MIKINQTMDSARFRRLEEWSKVSRDTDSCTPREKIMARSLAPQKEQLSSFY